MSLRSDGDDGVEVQSRPWRFNIVTEIVFLFALRHVKRESALPKRSLAWTLIVCVLAHRHVITIMITVALAT